MIGVALATVNLSHPCPYHADIPHPRHRWGLENRFSRCGMWLGGDDTATVKNVSIHATSMRGTVEYIRDGVALSSHDVALRDSGFHMLAVEYCRIPAIDTALPLRMA